MSKASKKGALMGIIAWILLGFVVGAVVALIRREDEHEPDHLFRTVGLAAGGALVGGFFAAAIDVGSVGDFFDLGAWLIAFACAVLALAVHDQVVAARKGPRRA
jgi:uncharacterized membrane protein YeaQ/YmgE (transglycosylase-associated protein family)